jgi:hypothetical protein
MFIPGQRTYVVVGSLTPPTGSVLIPANVSRPTALAFADRQALLPGAPIIPPVNNGSLQANLGNIASLPLGDRLQLNGIQGDASLIDFSGGGGGGNGGNGGGQNNGGTTTGGPINGIKGFRASRAAAYGMMAAQYQAQLNWQAMNAARSAVLANAYRMQTQVPDFTYGPAFASSDRPTNGFGTDSQPGAVNPTSMLAGFVTDASSTLSTQPTAASDSNKR